MGNSLVVATTIAVLCGSAAAKGADGEAFDTRNGDRMLAAYFREETRRLADECLADVKSWEDWTRRRETYRSQLREMLGLEPWPERTPLRAVVTGKVDHPEFTVEKLHFQSRPQLYVTANLYVPKNLEGPAPAVLYVCGHALVKKDGVSLGNKTKYQHHGAWFARNGYVCLVIDTLQLGEIEGAHHGTYRDGQWWWNARGYTPAGVEAWNSIRALDYLESRPEVDPKRLGVTGRSGGGAYSWFLTALDDRIQASVPVAGITNLESHVVDGCVEGHCDCMYFVNTYRWDYPQLAALAAPRPLLISNSDQDHIFPLDGVMDVYNKVRRIYELGDELDDLGLQITHGPHEDTQVLRVPAFQWFNHYLRGDDDPISKLAEPLFEPEQLKVFDALPTDEINTRVEEVFVAKAEEPKVPASTGDWQSQREQWLRLLSEKCFAGWPEASGDDEAGVRLREAFAATEDGVRIVAYDFDSQHDVRLRTYVLTPADVRLSDVKGITVRPLAGDDWEILLSAMRERFAGAFSGEPPAEASAEAFAEIEKQFEESRALAFVAPRGIGRTAWREAPLEQTRIRRRFMLLGQTLDGMRVWDVRRAIQALRSIDGLEKAPLSIEAEGTMAGIALYAALFEAEISKLELSELPVSHRQGPDFLNVLRILDMPQAVAMAAEKCAVRIRQADEGGWEYPAMVAEKLGWKGRVEIQRDAAVGR